MADPTASRISAAPEGRARRLSRSHPVGAERTATPLVARIERWLIVLILIAAGTGPVFGDNAAALNRRMGELYHRVGSRAMAEGERSLAARLWETALSFAPDSSDILCSLGQVYVADQKTIARGVELLQDAMAAASFQEHTEADCARHLSTALLSIQRCEDAVAVLLRYPFPSRPRYFQLLGRCLLRTGQTTAAVGALARGVARHPANPLLQALLAHAEGRGIGLDATDGPLLARLDRRELQLLLRLQLPDSDILTVARYAAGLANPPPEALFQLLLRGEAGANGVEAFLTAATPGRMDVVEALYTARQDDEVGRDVEAYYSRPDATYSWDRDADGFWEEQVTFADGRIRRWDVDVNQDGRTEVQVRFGEGLPETVRLGEERLIAYDRYPFVTSITLSSATTETRYDLIPGRFAVPVIPEDRLSSLTPYSPPRLRPGFAVLAEIDPVTVAYRGSVFPANGGAPIRRMELVAGVVVSRAEDTDRDGTMDRFVHLEDGVPVQARRDLDDDGRWDVAEFYADGQPDRYAVDLDGDGNVEYGVTAGRRGEQFWDFDDDGVVDLRRELGTEMTRN